jgi:hypothetical protein
MHRRLQRDRLQLSGINQFPCVCLFLCTHLYSIPSTASFRTNSDAGGLPILLPKLTTRAVLPWMRAAEV